MNKVKHFLKLFYDFRLFYTDIPDKVNHQIRVNNFRVVGFLDLEWRRLLQLPKVGSTVYPIAKVVHFSIWNRVKSDLLENLIFKNKS